MISSRLGMSGFFPVDKDFKLASGKASSTARTFGIVEHRRREPAPRPSFPAAESDGSPAFVGQARLASSCRSPLERRGQLARPIGAERAAAASATSSRRRKADQPDMVVKLDARAAACPASRQPRPSAGKSPGSCAVGSGGRRWRRRSPAPRQTRRLAGKRRQQRRRVGHVGGVDQAQQRHRRRFVRVGRDA